MNGQTMKERSKAAANTGFASGGLTCKVVASCFNLSSVLVDRFVLRNPPERKARKRYERVDKQFYLEIEI